MVVELVGGWMSNSLALLADAGHMFSDAGALVLSLFAAWITRRPANSQRTYGYYRAEILAALANGAALGAISIGIVWEAYQRLWDTPEVRGPLMMTVAVGGLLTISPLARPLGFTPLPWKFFGALAGFKPEGGDSSRGRLGVLVSKDITAGRSTWTPYASVSGVREAWKIGSESVTDVHHRAYRKIFREPAHLRKPRNEIEMPARE